MVISYVVSFLCVPRIFLEDLNDIFYFEEFFYLWYIKLGGWYSTPNFGKIVQKKSITNPESLWTKVEEQETYFVAVFIE